MFKIREFSKFTRVSVKMLRHYDDLGLLKPARVDAFTGYRYYAADQLPRLNRIIALKDLGFSLDQIGDLLDENLSADEMRGMLRLRRAQIEQQLQQEHARLTQVEARLAQIELSERDGKAQRVYDVVLRDLPSQLVASIRQVVPNADTDLANLFEELEAYVGSHHARAPACPLSLFHDEDYKDEWADVEVVVPLIERIPATARVNIFHLPEVREAACVVYTGSYDQLTDALSAILVWTEKNRYDIAGPLREVYLRYSASPKPDVPTVFLTDRGDELVTEIQVPVQKAREGT